LRSVSDNVAVYWLHEDICPDDLCDVKQQGHFIYRDGGHLSKEGSAFLGHKHNWMQQFRAIAN
jgi:hypothetical protein